MFLPAGASAGPWMLFWKGSVRTCDLNAAWGCGGVTLAESAISAEVRSVQNEPATTASLFPVFEARNMVH